MEEGLTTVSWGKPALKLLQYCEKLNDDLPAVMIIRHSERFEPKNLEEIHKASLTPRGKNLAKEFGNTLPKNRTYRLFYSPSERTKETAIKIQEGIHENGVKTESICISNILSHVLNVNDKFNYYLNRDMGDFLSNWMSYRYPPWEIEECAIFARRAAFEVFDNLHTLKRNVMDIYVSHDLFIGSFLFFWFGINTTTEWINYLDGFIFQIKDNIFHLFHKSGVKEIFSPYWLK